MGLFFRIIFDIFSFILFMGKLCLYVWDVIIFKWIVLISSVMEKLFEKRFVYFILEYRGDKWIFSLSKLMNRKKRVVNSELVVMK